MQDKIEELQTSAETAASAEAQQLRASLAAAQARLAEAEASISTLSSEKDSLQKRCVPLALPPACIPDCSLCLLYLQGSAPA